MDQANDFLENAVMTRITSGSFAPGQDTAFASLPGRKISEHDRIIGGGVSETLSGGRGKGTQAHDTLDGGGGRDQLLGRAGNDRLVAARAWTTCKETQANAGRDTLEGGADMFVFRSVGDCVAGNNRDVITNFHKGDRIGLSGLDADRLSAGNQDPDFTGMIAAENAIWYVSRKNAVIVRADNDGDGRADIEIMLAGVAHLAEGDFIL